MKKNLSVLLVLLTLLLPFATVLNACKKEASDTDNMTESESVDDTSLEESSKEETDDSTEVTENPDYEFSVLSDGTYAIKKFLNHTATEISVPDTHHGKAVTQILEDAFLDCSQLTSIILPDSLEEIAEGAFSGCSALKSLSVPFIGQNRAASASLGHLFGQTPFSGGQKVNQRYIADNGYQRQKPFYIPAGLTSVTVTDSIIKTYTFDSCVMLKEIVFGDGVTAIEANAFIECDGVERIRMGKGITRLEDECFQFLQNLKSVEIGSQVKTIGSYCFAYCESLESVTIPQNVTMIDRYAFSSCTSLKSITFERTTGWYRDYGSSSNTGMTVTNPQLNAYNLTNERAYAGDCWKRK